jgi:hypothetical protein
MKATLRPLRLSKETLCPLGDESLKIVQGGIPTDGFTVDCPDPSAAGTCATCNTCLTQCTTCQTGTTTSVNRPTGP